jgi:hypothetical protein
MTAGVDWSPLAACGRRLGGTVRPWWKPPAGPDFRERPWVGYVENAGRQLRGGRTEEPEALLGQRRRLQ